MTIVKEQIANWLLISL